jgi:hypothetical protein
MSRKAGRASRKGGLKRSKKAGLRRTKRAGLSRRVKRGGRVGAPFPEQPSSTPTYNLLSIRPDF